MLYAKFQGHIALWFWRRFLKSFDHMNKHLALIGQTVLEIFKYGVQQMYMYMYWYTKTNW